jgi:hypothetical protein
MTGTNGPLRRKHPEGEYPGGQRAKRRGPAIYRRGLFRNSHYSTNSLRTRRAFKLAFGLTTLLIRIVLAGLLALTAGILLLLSGLLAAALLLARLLSRILVLLARVRILVSHHDLPF